MLPVEVNVKMVHISEPRGGGGDLNDKRRYQARPWTHKKYPKHVFRGLKFVFLNKYSSGIDTLNKYFSIFSTLNKK